MATRRSASPAVHAAYVLHHHDWSESSLILELWTREHGRIAAVAKGAKRPHSQLRSVLLPFQRLLISLGGKAAQKTASAAQGQGQGLSTASPSADHAPPDIHLLRSAEWAAGRAMPTGSALLAGFHLNELLLRGVARHDPHPHLFDVYSDTLAHLRADDEAYTAAALRAFELWWLHDSGVLPRLDVVTMTQTRVHADTRHALHPEHGITRLREQEPGGLSGERLCALQEALDHDDHPALRHACASAPLELRQQLRGLLHYHLDTSMLRTRALMVDLQKWMEPRAT